MARFDKLIRQLKEVSSIAADIKNSGAVSGAQAASAAQSATLSPTAVANALEIASRNNNNTMTQIAIRLAQLSQKNPQRAA